VWLPLPERFRKLAEWAEQHLSPAEQEWLYQQWQRALERSIEEPPDESALYGARGQTHMRYGHDSPENGPHRCYTSARDAAAVADYEAAQLVAAERDDWTERFDTLRGRLQHWRARAETAEALVVSLLSQMCGVVDHFCP
jgi:hypothetical protein